MEMVPRARIELATRGFSVRDASDASAIDSTTCEGSESCVTPGVTPDDTKHALLKELLQGLSKEEIIALLAEKL
ncbi:MAG: hypothetical protein BWY07_02450 [Candidatus Hydrogenedentes bacterium ADurb.Bin170]|nr:MAG: hypothetical protein BWY07_02450 [Candidatus Hydrogenedentes bacterium ADurb.Bin170]